MTGAVHVALIGAAGRMGLEIAKAAGARQDLRIVAAVERLGSPGLGCDLGRLCGLEPTGVVVTDDLDRALEGVQVAVEMSTASTTAEAVSRAARAGVAYVCGTTGLGQEAFQALEEASRRVPVLSASNLSPGVAVLRALVGQAIRALGPEYDIEIVETHHKAKVDAPSGTALDLAHAAAQARQGSTELRHGRHGQAGPRSPQEIGLHAVRAGGVFGDHTVLIAGPQERLELIHRAGSRVLFAEGALRAALFVAGKPPGRYSMADVLGLDETLLGSRGEQAHQVG
jgi:4-hydroxy-tetrahydrodipicolinate reductase